MNPLIAGNWKMNGLSSSVEEVEKLIKLFEGSFPNDRDILICPPATLVALFASEFEDEGLLIGGQDCHPQAAGAHTGDVSAEMLADAGAAFVIVGHSERRADHGESDGLVRAKAEAAQRAGLTPIICVGETQFERKSRREKEIVAAQLAGSVPPSGEFAIAYEPVWAIGTGVTPTVKDIAEMHAFIRSKVGGTTRILYGGSVKPGNAKEILSIDAVAGALVGGASLKAEEFASIIRAAR